jgi:hypothetical protein
VVPALLFIPNVPLCRDCFYPRFAMARSYGSERIDGSEWGLSGVTRFSDGMLSAVDRPGAYSRALTCQSEAPIKA